MLTSWPFCPHCGTILSAPSEVELDVLIKCDYCSFECNFSKFRIDPVVTTSMPRQRPLWLDERKNEGENFLDESAIGSENKHATIDEPCPRCKHPTLYFYTMQLRSVDEGSTVFYECPKCAHKFSQNN